MAEVGRLGLKVWRYSHKPSSTCTDNCHSKGAIGPAVALGYAGAVTDAGHSIFGDIMDAGLSARSWALASPGNVDWTLLQDFASVALDDMTNLAKGVIESFYGKAPKYSYWNGCSTGGRQGLMQAQRYPKNYDGILAVSS